MTRGIFIVGNESSLFSAITAEAAKRVELFASAFIPNRLPMRDSALLPKGDTGGTAIRLSWNPSSPLSARTLVLAAENRLGLINDAILICSPPAVYKTADLLEPEEIEMLVDDHIKGWFFLIRELTRYFRGCGKGTLSFVAPEVNPVSRNVQTDLLGSPAGACFTGFAGGVLASSVNEPFLTMGFSGSETGEKGEFASWLFKIVDEGAAKNRGRWNKFSKLGLFR